MKPSRLFGIASIFVLLGLLSGAVLDSGSISWTKAVLAVSLLAFAVKFGLAIWVYMKNPSAKVNSYFAIVFAGQALWDLGKFVMWILPTPEEAFFWARLSYSGYIISVFFLLSFVWAYLKKKNYFTTVPGRIVIYTPMVFMLISLWLSNIVIYNVIPPDVISRSLGIDLWDYQYGIIYNNFFLWFQILPFLYAFFMFVFKYFRVKRADKKKQLMYLVLGSAFPIMIGIPTGVVLPLFGINLPPHNNILSLIMSVFIAVGIIKYKFLSIQPVGETIVEGRKLDHKLAEQYRFEVGHSYFINHERSSEIAHKVLLTHLYKKKYGLIITAHNPSTIRHEYGIETTPVVWITDTETEHLAIDPLDIEQLYETIRRFVESAPNSYVLIDGLDYLVVHNNFVKILHFIKQVQRTVSGGDDCLIVTQGSLVLEPKKQKLLETAFIVLPSSRKTQGVSAEKDWKGKKINYIIIGHNPLAQSIIHEFEDRKIVPTVVDKQEILVHYPKGMVHMMKGDPLSRKVLEHAGINKPNTVVLVTLENDSDVILCINKLRQLSDNAKIITNINNPNFQSIAIKAGADRVIPASAIGGRLISLAITSPDVVRWVMDATTYSAKELELAEMTVERKSPLIGKTIRNADDLLCTAGNIISVRAVDGLKQIPHDDYKIKEGDVLVLVTNLKELPKGANLSDKVHKCIRRSKK
ncbi:MAG: DUF835 domain-containing protein [Candidatus Woesearchaeota archaeon]